MAAFGNALFSGQAVLLLLCAGGDEKEKHQ